MAAQSAEFDPLRDLLRRHFDQKAVRACHEIKAFIAATNVQTGKVRIFTREELSIDALLASACLPNVHDAVVIDGVPYWDGGFRGNPPIWPFIYESDSRDVVIVEVDPPFRAGVPQSNAEVADRLNEITFGGALIAEMRAIAFVQDLIDKGAITGEFGQRLKTLMIHSIDDEASLAPLGSVSKFKIEPAFLEYLFGLGRPPQPSGWPRRSTGRRGEQHRHPRAISVKWRHANRHRSRRHEDRGHRPRRRRQRNARALRVPTPARHLRGDRRGDRRPWCASSKPRSARAARVGVGHPGAISPATGLIKNANSTRLNGHPLERDLERALGATRCGCRTTPTALPSPRRPTARRRGCGIVFGVILGTGVGGGIVIDGRPLAGAQAIAGEWGHNRPAPAARRRAARPALLLRPLRAASRPG